MRVIHLVKVVLTVNQLDKISLKNSSTSFRMISLHICNNIEKNSIGKKMTDSFHLKNRRKDQSNFKALKNQKNKKGCR